MISAPIRRTQRIHRPHLPVSSVPLRDHARNGKSSRGVELLVLGVDHFLARRRDGVGSRRHGESEPRRGDGRMGTAKLASGRAGRRRYRVVQIRSYLLEPRVSRSCSALLMNDSSGLGLFWPKCIKETDTSRQVTWGKVACGTLIAGGDSEGMAARARLTTTGRRDSTLT